jgi:hypothetical protein
MIQAATGNISLTLRVPSRWSTALTLIWFRRAEARRRWFPQGALLREMPRLAIGVTATSLAAVDGIEGVAVSSKRVSAGRVVA